MTSPMMRQYHDIKGRNKDYILLFRLGDFYEMFYDDALLVSQELDLTLTGRDCGEKERAPMCGVPYHSVDSYIARLVAKGYKVAMCDQMGEPVPGKIVEREVVRVITPGTVTSEAMLDAGKNNFLAACFMTEKLGVVAFADISTGELMATLIDDEELDERMASEIAKFPPAELLYMENSIPCRKTMTFATERLGSTLSPIAGFCRELETKALSYYSRDYFEKIGVTGSEIPICIGMIIDYLEETQKGTAITLSEITIYSGNQYMELDAVTRRNLELTETMRNKEKRGSLLWVLDRCVTSGGARTLRKWTLQPLSGIAPIKRRQGAIAELVDNLMVSEEMKNHLKKTNDLQRLSARLTMRSANARDLNAIYNTLSKIPPLREELAKCKSLLLISLCEELDPCDWLRNLIETAIVDKEIPFSVREGGIIKDGYNEEIDRMRYVLKNSKDLMVKIEEREREHTGIKTLKIGYNRVFGYYLEVTKSYYDQVPAEYIRKQTLANCERYITEELKQLEGEVLTAGERLSALEYQVFTEVLEGAIGHVKRLQTAAENLAVLDVLLSLSDVAREFNYVCPDVNLGDRIEVKNGRHPVVEQVLEHSLFVPNDTVLDNDDNRMNIITGPNMAGKSTYMRQVALIALMAQMGAFVPADSASISICDKIFTRVGASDDLAMGQSTFMVEMSETAAILKNATERSLLIFDEIGRGTSTFDGMSIARSVVEYVLDKQKIGGKTLFATHYHELCALEGELEGIKNYNIAVKKRGDDITFLRKIVRGGADDSYGIEVAKLAGVPQKVITRAKEILKSIEAGSGIEPPKRLIAKAEDSQMSFGSRVQNELIEDLGRLDVSTLTPLEALNLLDAIVRKARA